MFYLVENREPDIRKPVQLKERARGLQLRGWERDLLGKNLAREDMVSTF